MKIRKSYLVEVLLAQKTNNYFPIDTFLDGKKILGIEVFSSTQIAKAPSGASVTNADIVKSAYLSFDVDGTQPIQNLPMSALITSNNNGVMKEFDAMQLRLVKSFLTFPTPVEITADEVILINFYYED